MANKDRDGGPAFPFEYHNQTRSYQDGFFGTPALPPDASQQFGGMSLRDWFAGQAVSGFISDSENQEMTFDELAEFSYEMADAMLKQREKVKP